MLMSNLLSCYIMNKWSALFKDHLFIFIIKNGFFINFLTQYLPKLKELEGSDYLITIIKLWLIGFHRNI